MIKSGRLRRAAREWLAAALGVAALAVAVTVYLRETAHTTYRLRISAGSQDGQRHQIAERLRSAARRLGVELTLVATPGSGEALERVNAGSLDLALVQGGLDPADRGHVRQVATLKVEPLHLMVKAEYEPQPADEEARGLDFLRGRTVNLSETGSGTYDLAREVLAFAGLASPDEVSLGKGDYTPRTLSYRELLAETDRAKLPDAVFTVSPLPSRVVKHLLTRRDYRLVPLRFGEAFSLDDPHLQDVPSNSKPPRLTRYGIDRSHVYNTEIPAYTYGISPAAPMKAVPTFGTRLLIVANESAPAEALRRVLEVVYSSAPKGLSLDPGLLDLTPELEWHQGTVDYRERNKLLSIGDTVDFMEKSTSLMGGLLGGSFFLWQWYRHRVRRRREAGFESYMLKVTDIEQRALEIETSADLDLGELLQLQVEISRLKSEALKRFADGELEGEEMISGFVAHVNDARDYVTRLILHERENVEQKAVQERRPAQAIWAEEVGDGPHPASVASTALSEGPGV